jgi:hypothetical protein
MATLEAMSSHHNFSPEALGDLAIGSDAGEIDGPVWSVSDRGTAGALDRVAQIPARLFRLGLTRVL